MSHLSPSLVCQMRHSWENDERCTAIVTGSMSLLTVYVLHGGCDGEHYITELELVRIISISLWVRTSTLNSTWRQMGEGWISKGREFGLVWVALAGMRKKREEGEGCPGTYTKKHRWQHLLRDFECVVMNTWRKGCKEAYYYIMGPRVLRCHTWYLNKESLRGWSHFPVLIKVEGRKLKQVRGRKGWAPNMEGEKRKFKNRVLCHHGARDWVGEGDVRETRFIAGEIGGRRDISEGDHDGDAEPKEVQSSGRPQRDGGDSGWAGWTPNTASKGEM